MSHGARSINLAGRQDLYTAAEAADLLRVPVALVERQCAAAARVDGPPFFCGAWEDAEKGWIIPQRVLARELGRGVQRHYRVKDIAVLYGLGERSVRARVKVVPAGVALKKGRRAHELGARLFFGSEIRVPECELCRLEAGEVA